MKVTYYIASDGQKFSTEEKYKHYQSKLNKYDKLKKKYKDVTVFNVKLLYSFKNRKKPFKIDITPFKKPTLNMNYQGTEYNTEFFWSLQGIPVNVNVAEDPDAEVHLDVGSEFGGFVRANDYTLKTTEIDYILKKLFNKLDEYLTNFLSEKKKELEKMENQYFDDKSDFDISKLEKCFK